MFRSSRSGFTPRFRREAKGRDGTERDRELHLFDDERRLWRWSGSHDEQPRGILNKSGNLGLSYRGYGFDLRVQAVDRGMRDAFELPL